MTLADYLTALDKELAKVSGLIITSAIQREIDENLGVGFIKGQITFVDGSRFEFTEQLPTERKKFRLHYMNSENNLIARWDSAPHHRDVSTFPFHKHILQGVEPHPATTTLEALSEIARILKV